MSKSKSVQKQLRQTPAEILKEFEEKYRIPAEPPKDNDYEWRPTSEIIKPLQKNYNYLADSQSLS